MLLQLYLLGQFSLFGPLVVFTIIVKLKLFNFKSWDFSSLIERVLGGVGVQSQFFFILTQKHQRGYQKTYPNQETAKKILSNEQKKCNFEPNVISGREHKKQILWSILPHAKFPWICVLISVRLWNFKDGGS